MTLQQKSFEELDLSASDFRLDMLALAAIREANVVIYVSSLEIVPSELHRSELRLVRKMNTRLLSVLNKREQQLRALGAPRVNAREAQWREMLGSEGVGGVFTFDAHWDRYSKLVPVYAHIATLLPTGNRAVFVKGLEAFDAELQTKRTAAGKLAAGYIRACRAIVETAETERYDYDTGNVRSMLRARVAASAAELASEYTSEVAKLYLIEIETGDQQLRLSESERKLYGERIAKMAGHSAVGGGIASVIGGLIGLLFGPVGAVAGAVIGAKIGAGVGAGVGLVSGAVTETNTHVEAKLSPQDLRETALFCLAVVWCLTHQGFGKDPTVVASDFLNTQELVRANVSSIRHPDWETCSDANMREWFEEQLAELAI